MTWILSIILGIVLLIILSLISSAFMYLDYELGIPIIPIFLAIMIVAIITLVVHSLLF